MREKRKKILREKPEKKWNKEDKPKTRKIITRDKYPFNYRPRRKFRISIEALFMIDFPALKNKFSFYLDRKSKRGEFKEF